MISIFPNDETIYKPFTKDEDVVDVIGIPPKALTSPGAGSKAKVKKMLDIAENSNYCGLCIVKGSI